MRPTYTSTDIVGVQMCILSGSQRGAFTREDSGVGGTVDSERPEICWGPFYRGFEPRHRRPRLNRVLESLRSPFCGRLYTNTKPLSGDSNFSHGSVCKTISRHIRWQ
ncbi:hypothetical protein PoB_004505800 [Plakobranchus ocellatus]|uniref:Uncharacterized protein n=1 Tax=Plakobranchus ocellatus TaxID=259542 RepID=A0AAV4BIC2_9GAST|nr:hypothetical protein PoB_004505800 [Plakobranchus ocellatus]